MPMKTAVLRTLGKTPRFEEFPDPEPTEGEVIVHVKAASLKNIDKMMACGSHYDSHTQLPVVCGIDGVGILEDGTRVFCGGSRPPSGCSPSVVSCREPGVCPFLTESMTSPPRPCRIPPCLLGFHSFGAHNSNVARRS